MQHRAHTTPIVCVDELTGALPLEVRVVQLVVLVEYVQIVGQFLVRRELIDMDVRTIGSRIHVILRPGAHDDRQYIAAECVNEEFLRYIVLAVGVLERQIELVVVVKNVEALVGSAARTLEGAARTVDINLNIEHFYILHRSTMQINRNSFYST